MIIGPRDLCSAGIDRFFRCSDKLQLKVDHVFIIVMLAAPAMCIIPADVVRPVVIYVLVLRQTLAKRPRLPQALHV